MDVDATAAGMDDARLERITEHITRAYMEPGKLAGCQVLVARHGHLAYHRNFGTLVVGGDRPVTDDSIWRIYSMTKPITSVALMSLYEHGRFKLTDPAHRYLPEWRDQRVGVVDADGTLQLVEPDRPVQIRDLLTHTSGLSYGWDLAHPVDQLYGEAGVRGGDVDLETLVKLLGDLPLKFQPGTAWHYSLATDVCGRLVEVLADQPFDAFLQEHLFDPLGMPDTGFTVPPESLDRFTANHGRQPDKSLVVTDDPYDSIYGKPRPLLSGGGGLVSTMGDYAALLRDAPARRRARGTPGARAGDAAVHDPQPPPGRRRDRRPRHQRALGCRLRRRGLRARVRHHPRPRRHGRDRLGGRLLLGRRREHDLLGRPDPGPVRDLHGAAHAVGHLRLPQPAQGAGVPRDRLTSRLS